MWSKSTIGFLLADTVYIGECYLTKRSGKTSEPKPKEEKFLSKVLRPLVVAPLARLNVYGLLVHKRSLPLVLSILQHF